MPKQQLDQKQPAKVSSKAMAQRKKAKLLKEKAKLDELRKQFPKLFSPEKVKSIEQRNKQLVQPSLKKSVITPPPPVVRKKLVEVEQPEPVADLENIPQNTRNRKPFSASPMMSTPTKKDNSTPSRVLQVLASPSPRHSSSLQASALPGCSCSKRQSTATVGGRESISMDDVENVQCDICAQIGPQANTRKDVVDALRNFIHKPASTPSAEISQVTSEENENEDEEETSTVDEVSAGMSAVNNLMSDMNMELPSPEVDNEDDVHVEKDTNEEKLPQKDKESVAPFPEEIVDSEGEECQSVDSTVPSAQEVKPLAPGCFDQMLRSSLATGRVRGRVVGRKVLAGHVEFICKFQVLKEGYTFQEIDDMEYMQDCTSPSENLTPSQVSPYSIQMCILRRYSDFEKLQENLLLESKKANVDITDLQKNFPGKQFFGSFGKRWADPVFLKSRETGLSTWINDSALPSLSAVTSSPKRLELQDKFVTAIHKFISM
mmetsp:Transcript_4040/g.6867  ORF Transcript_4040/g.6867 Transcript_4040/m.6867 type:complete len:489 (-) Transcript_4040:311-1777(-)